MSWDQRLPPRATGAAKGSPFLLSFSRALAFYAVLTQQQVSTHRGPVECPCLVHQWAVLAFVLCHLGRGTHLSNCCLSNLGKWRRDKRHCDPQATSRQMVALLLASVLVCLLHRAGIGETSLKSITQELEGTFGQDDEGGKHCWPTWSCS